MCAFSLRRNFNDFLKFCSCTATRGAAAVWLRFRQLSGYHRKLSILGYFPQHAEHWLLSANQMERVPETGLVSAYQFSGTASVSLGNLLCLLEGVSILYNETRQSHRPTVARPLCLAVLLTWWFATTWRGAYQTVKYITCCCHMLPVVWINWKSSPILLTFLWQTFFLIAILQTAVGVSKTGAVWYVTSVTHVTSDLL